MIFNFTRYLNSLSEIVFLKQFHYLHDVKKF